MTGNTKRFVMIYFETDGNLIFDDKTGEKEWFDSTECMQDEEIVEMLNTLHKENTELKQQNKHLFKMIRMADKIITEYMPLEVIYEWKNGLKEIKE